MKVPAIFFLIALVLTLLFCSDRFIGARAAGLAEDHDQEQRGKQWRRNSFGPEWQEFVRPAVQ